MDSRSPLVSKFEWPLDGPKYKFNEGLLVGFRYYHILMRMQGVIFSREIPCKKHYQRHNS